MKITGPGFIAICLLSATNSWAAVDNGRLSVRAGNLKPGTVLDLTGQWLYQPGYAIQSGQKPETAVANDCVPVPVPQLLSRIQWWLDDSEDFKRYENQRLKALGFDTERAEDGWYYLRVNLPDLPDDRRLFIQFEGVAMISRAYCNGQLLGEHKGMFSRFDYDLTPHLKPGQNLLAVFVSMEKIRASTLSMGEAVTVNLTASKVKTMSKGMFGPLSPNFDNRAYDLHGIWQPVKLVVRGPARLDDVWFVPKLDSAEVRVQARSLAPKPRGRDNSTPAPARTARLRAKWFETDGNKVFAEILPEKIELGPEMVNHTLQLKNVKPKLWTPAEPNLYRLEVVLESANGDILDSWTQKVGFRTFEARGNRFFLNGNPYWLRGANHLPYGKNPFDPALARNLIGMLHDANVRITRTHATPWNEAWLTAADEIGLGVSLEGIRPWALAGKVGATPPGLMDHWLMENEDVVKRARNHPSLLIYTVGNEMMLRDTRNLEKWKQLSEVVKQTRKLDPTLPVICSSEYSREPEFYNELIKPNGLDDGDVDDIHRYNNWYGPSSFVTDARFEREAKNNGGARPLIGQEMSSGYPDLDTGLPVLRYTRDLLTPQAWVGNLAYPGNNPKFFLEHHRAVTKRWAERLRFERGDRTAGFSLFATECWFSHSYDVKSVKPYPVVEAVRQAFSPIGLALETGRRRFFSEEEFETGVFITNDDEQARDYSGLRLVWKLQCSGKRAAAEGTVNVPELRYLDSVKVPIRIKFPVEQRRAECVLHLSLFDGERELSHSIDPVEVLPAQRRIDVNARLFSRSLGPELTRLLQSTAPGFAATADPASAQLLLLGRGDDLQGLETGGSVRTAIERGATAIAFSPGDKLTSMFAAAILDAKVAPGEYADFSPCAGTVLAEGLGPMDLKWWGRKNDWRVFVADTSHRLTTNSTARELIRFIPPHGYIAEEKKAEQYRTVLFEIPIGSGRLWVCDLDLEKSVFEDPVAQRFALNLLRAAMDRASTRQLPRVPMHEELLKVGAR